MSIEKKCECNTTGAGLRLVKFKNETGKCHYGFLQPGRGVICACCGMLYPVDTQEETWELVDEVECSGTTDWVDVSASVNKRGLAESYTPDEEDEPFRVEQIQLYDKRADKVLAAIRTATGLVFSCSDGCLLGTYRDPKFQVLGVYYTWLDLEPELNIWK